MTVAELIKELKKLPPKAEVVDSQEVWIIGVFYNKEKEQVKIV